MKTPLCGSARLGLVLSALALAGLCALPARAQPPQAAAPAAPVLKLDQVTEDALVQSLEVEAPDQEGGTMRSIRPTARRGSDRSTAASASGRSSLLITFATDSAELTPESRTALGTVARALQSDKLAGFAFSIEGHADPRGNAERNLKLSTERAKSVVDFLVAQHGILPERLEAVGKGSSELLNPGRPDAPENRRVTIVTKRP